MQRPLLPISILTIILFVAALTSYLIPSQPESPPKRVLMENKGGKVILTHAQHTQALDEQCSSCHHTSGNDPDPLPCGTCHVKKFDESFLSNHQTEFNGDQCIVCHHAPSSTEKFSHDDHETDYADNDCQACHHDESIEPEPQACSNCHSNESSADTPSLKDAAHTRCGDCHNDFYQEGIRGCSQCHTRKSDVQKVQEQQACSNCHVETVDTLIPTRTNAFHTQCMQCHETQKTGPFGDDTCYQCHMK